MAMRWWAAGIAIAALVLVGAPASHAQRRAVGTIYVSADADGAQVFVDGQLYGVIPQRINNIEAGEHVVEVRHPQRQPYRMVVNVRPRGMARVIATLDVLRGAAGVVAQQPQIGPDPPDLAACNRGDMTACVNAGYDYDSGRNNVTRDDRRAFALYQRACTGGQMHGCHNLGVFYRDGRVVPQNDVRAVQLFRQACDNGDIEGCGKLGWMYGQGRGVPQDDYRAATLSRQACDGDSAGHRDWHACNYMGWSYENGRGVPRDIIRANAYYREACTNGVTDACGRIRGVP